MSTAKAPAPRKPKPFRLTRPTAPESFVLESVLQVLAYHPAVAWAGRFNSGGMRIGEGKNQRYVRFNTVAGLSDVMGQLKDGRILAVECKRIGERPTTDQQGFLDQVNKHGGVAFCAWSADDVVVRLKGWTTPLEQMTAEKPATREMETMF